MPANLWPDVPLEPDAFRYPPREYGILPFWFLNGELDAVEMRRQLRELREKGMSGVILHGRYGLEMPYLGPEYIDRIRLAVEEAAKLGLPTWVYDEMNWPSGTADGKVLRARPDLAQRYIECISFPVSGPWFGCLTGTDSRYMDFERSTPVAAFALGSDGRVVDLTPKLSFTNVVPWEAPAGNWQVMYLVEKRADYYIDALDPEATSEFLRLGYDPYADALGASLGSQVPGFYTDEPAMHYYVTGSDNPIVPWTKDMFCRFQERNGYNLRPRLPDLFFDVCADSARVRYDFYTTLTEFYSDAYYRQIHEWCKAHGVVFTGHLLYEEWLRKMIRVEGNVFKHYVHFDVVGVDHLYPYIGSRDRPDEHVALKVASSAAHQLGSPRLLCESFGGIFMDATMQRMKWIADWQYVLGVNLLNPHGFHYTLEGPRKRDWPPSMFYQYPWWHYYGEFSLYISRLSQMLSGGRHVAKVAVIWPINALFGTYTPQRHNALADRTEGDFNALTDLLLRLHYDFDYLDEDVLAEAEQVGGALRVGDEAHELLILPPMPLIKLGTVERLEQFVAGGGRLLGMVFLPDRAYGPDGLVDITARMSALFGVDPAESQRDFRAHTGIDTVRRDHDGGGKTAFLRSYALARRLPLCLQRDAGLSGQPESPFFVAEVQGDVSRYWFAPPDGPRLDITTEVTEARCAVADALQQVLGQLIAPDVRIDNPDLFYLHRVKDEQDLYFFVNPTFSAQTARVMLSDCQPELWDPSTGSRRPMAWTSEVDRTTSFALELPPAGSTFVLAATKSATHVQDTNIVIEHVNEASVEGYARAETGCVVIDQQGRRERLEIPAAPLAEPLVLDGEWQFVAEDANALVVGTFRTTIETAAGPHQDYAAPGTDVRGWVPMVPGAWSYQLSAEPDAPYPINVWYRIDFDVDDVPPRLELLVDGFAGSHWLLFMNGEPATATPVQSAIDCQMRSVDVTSLVQRGVNVLALRLTVTSATDGLLDLVKITGSFGLRRRENGTYAICALRTNVQPAPWTTQGYPFFSGRGLYRRTFCLPSSFEGRRVFLHPALADDVLEVIVNGQCAGVRLWAPYDMEITSFLRSGDNTLELRVANTLVNVLQAVERPSGLVGPPKLVPCQSFVFELSPAAVAGSTSGR